MDSKKAIGMSDDNGDSGKVLDRNMEPTPGVRQSWLQWEAQLNRKNPELRRDESSAGAETIRNFFLQTEPTKALRLSTTEASSSANSSDELGTGAQLMHITRLQARKLSKEKAEMHITIPQQKMDVTRSDSVTGPSRVFKRSIWHSRTKSVQSIREESIVVGRTTSGHEESSSLRKEVFQKDDQNQTATFQRDDLQTEQDNGILFDNSKDASQRSPNPTTSNTSAESFSTQSTIAKTMCRQEETLPICKSVFVEKGAATANVEDESGKEMCIQRDDSQVCPNGGAQTEQQIVAALEDRSPKLMASSNEQDTRDNQASSVTTSTLNNSVKDKSQPVLEENLSNIKELDEMAVDSPKETQETDPPSNMQEYNSDANADSLKPAEEVGNEETLQPGSKESENEHPSSGNQGDISKEELIGHAFSNGNVQ